MTEYKEAQIIKHALQYYINRSGADEKDLITEKQLLREWEDEVERLKCRNRIS